MIGIRRTWRWELNKFILGQKRIANAHFDKLKFMGGEGKYHLESDSRGYEGEMLQGGRLVTGQVPTCTPYVAVQGGIGKDRILEVCLYHHV